jgi:B12-binding domain/radical SAM domain protein
MEKKEINFKNLPGIAFLDENGELIRGPSRPKIDLNSYCPYSDNKSFPLHPPIELMRGCAFRCRFCQVGYMYGNPRFRSLDEIIQIVKHYIKFFKPLKKQVDIRFIAPNSLGYMEKKKGKPNHTALFQLVQRLKVLDVRTYFGTFPSEVRPEYITDDILTLWDDLANQQVSVGFQSGSDRILQDMRRGHTVEDGLRAHDLLTSHRLTPLFDFLLGTPSETVEDQWETLDLIRDLGKKARVRMHYFMPLPGTPWAKSIPAPLGRNIQTEIGRLARAEIITGEFAKQIDFSFNEN